jgi:hypothetical protein
MTEIITANRANELSLVIGSREKCLQIFMGGCFPSYFTDFLRGARLETEIFLRRKAGRSFPTRTVFHWLSAFVAIL